MTKETATKEWVEFLQTVPPNSSRSIPALVGIDPTTSARHVSAPLLHLHCDHDGGIRKFSWAAGQPRPSVDVYLGPAQASDVPVYKFLTYRCRNCLHSEKTFALAIEWKDCDVEVMKLGEFPPFSAPISPRIKNLLDDTNFELYRKGVRATAQGLGIGAASYFRRIVEDQWKRLVTEIRRAAEQLGAEDLSIYDAAIRERQFSSAVDVLKDAIPPKLLILNGQNPLTLLHRPLSRQLHGLTDEQCLEQAEDIRLVLASLVENIAGVLRDESDLRAAASRLTRG